MRAVLQGLDPVTHILYMQQPSKCCVTHTQFLRMRKKYTGKGIRKPEFKSWFLTCVRKSRMVQRKIQALQSGRPKFTVRDCYLLPSLPTSYLTSLRNYCVTEGNKRQWLRVCSQGTRVRIPNVSSSLWDSRQVI